MDESQCQLTLIDNIPLVTDTLIPPHNGIDVSLHHLEQRGVVESAPGHPRRQLAVPDQSVAANLLAVLGGKSHDGVGVVEGEVPLGGLRGFPLHCVLRRDRPELGLDNLLLLRVVPDREGSTDILLACGLEGGIKGCWGLAGVLSRPAEWCEQRGVALAVEV